MTWTKLPEDFNETDAVVNLTDGAYRLYVASLIQANRRLSNGFIAAGAVRMMVPRFQKRQVSELLAHQLWTLADGGYAIARFLEEEGGHQLSRAQLEERRADRSNAGRLGADARWGARARSSQEAKPLANAMARESDVPQVSGGITVPRTPYPRTESRRDTSSLRFEDARVSGIRPIGSAVLRTQATLAARRERQ